MLYLHEVGYLNNIEISTATTTEEEDGSSGSVRLWIDSLWAHVSAVLRHSGETGSRDHHSDGRVSLQSRQIKATSAGDIKYPTLPPLQSLLLAGGAVSVLSVVGDGPSTALHPGLHAASLCTHSGALSLSLLPLVTVGVALAQRSRDAGGGFCVFSYNAGSRIKFWR